MSLFPLSVLHRVAGLVGHAHEIPGTIIPAF